MNKTLWLWGIWLFSLLALILVVPSAAEAKIPQDGVVVISEDPEQEVFPAIAYNSQRQEYLLVWHNDRAGCDDIRAQRVSKDGTLAGGPFYISAGCTADRRYPDVIYNSAHDQYLVVWEQETGAGWSIQGRRVSGTGQLLNVADITIRSANGNTSTAVKPAVAYASTSDRYLVVWAETWHPGSITYEIRGQVLTETGSLEGNSFFITQGSDPVAEPDLAYNRHANRYLVVWQLDAGTLWDIHGQQVHGGGGLFGGDITIAYYTRSSTAPAVASIPTAPTDEKFLVVWELLHNTGDRDIYGRLVSEDGTPGSDFWISWADVVDESSPVIAASEDMLQYYVAWRHPQGVVDNPIKGRSITYSGEISKQTDEYTGVAADHPALAIAGAGDLMIAWQDQPIAATDTNIYGQARLNRLEPPYQINIPLVLRNFP